MESGTTKQVKQGGSTKKTCGGCGKSLPVAKIRCSCGHVMRKKNPVKKKDYSTRMNCSEIKRKLERRANQLWATHEFNVVVLYHSKNPKRQHCSTFATVGLGQKFVEETGGVVESLFKKFVMSNIEQLNEVQLPSADQPVEDEVQQNNTTVGEDGGPLNSTTVDDEELADPS